ncbi:QueT transporter family protein [Enterococcus sp. BWB1-3]|uniref:QueT transporter family protein n=1 Tax=unclassified Enterococcus TaxID=2608891 RepID=UPI00192429DA|nr:MULTISPECIES: QueT transporter family protein [unclassified Enterococcus]MBL1229819.1 QueT transporter family protein [Enterococcus sp. BWB1-3]MCB5952431.1 QueT transporter family protein [Enterococcus sp. BWT-B8]MCB5955383.1 QueT transporter family protein [Enterococcus sp. CWB-B31]
MQSSVSSGKKLRVVTLNAIIMALYLALTLFVAPVASGPIQFRISESLNHLVVFNRKLMWGVLGGVIFYNIIFGYGVIDALYGGAQTFVSLGLTALLYNKVKSEKIRLVLNTLFFTVSMVFIAVMLVNTGGAENGGFWTTYLFLALSEFIVMALSAPLMYFLNKKIHFESRI